MNTTATLPAVSPPSVLSPPPPVVFVGGAPEPRLSVTRYRATAPLDRREVRLTAEDPAAWAGVEAVVAQPVRLRDEEVRWVVLGVGRLSVQRTRSVYGTDSRRLVLMDRLDERLGRPVPGVWWERPGGRLVVQETGRLSLDRPGNRSAERFEIHGRSVHVLAESGGAWTVGTALASVAALAELSLSLALLPPAIADAPLTDAVDLADPLGDVLEALLEPYNLTLQRALSRQGASLIERIAVMPAAASRSAPTGDAVEQLERPGPEAARLWVARGGRPVVESTFDLHPDWDPALAEESDAAYGRSTSSGFSRVRRVFRQWSLNEDGRLSPGVAPLNLTGLFGLGVTVRPQPITFSDCVSLDTAGENSGGTSGGGGGGSVIPPVVEASVDGGVTWSRWAGRAVLNVDHAGVYLDDDQLPGGFLDAARSGGARVRVTGSLVSPTPVRSRRWRGNPFAGTGDPVVFDLGERFPVRRVEPASIHAAAGLPSGAVDKREELARWLVDRLDQADAVAERPGSARARLAGARPLLRVGDRLPELGVRIVTVDCDFEQAATTVYA